MKNIIVLVSGGGTNLQALLEAEQAGAFPGGSITCVISSRGDAYALRRAEQFHVKSRVIAKKDYPDRHLHPRHTSSLPPRSHHSCVS